MLTPADFATYSRWAGVATLVMAGLTVLTFVFRWGVRFRFVGITGFLGVVTVGLFALSIVPIVRAPVPGAAKYTLVYDNGATQVVITVPPAIERSALEATLVQAANDLFSLGRLGRGGDRLTVIARTVVHPEPGVTEPVILGVATRSLSDRANSTVTVRLLEPSARPAPKLQDF
ncbi:Ycf51 family protein [uncultured Thermosynechococcus sp.]|uniref:Ycf51 family protein n=2 Tax=uncultured Thermosynechococcus sp. TaxID=436945 RepID=UPI00262D34AE|nr:Ycf51 family protein [uncultured Thermosynechococcus sp.]